MTNGNTISFGSILSTVRPPLTKCAGGSTCVPHWPTWQNCCTKNPDPRVPGFGSYQYSVRTVSLSKPFQWGMSGENVCVRSTNGLLAIVAYASASDGDWGFASRTVATKKSADAATMAEIAASLVIIVVTPYREESGRLQEAISVLIGEVLERNPFYRFYKRGSYVWPKTL